MYKYYLYWYLLCMLYEFTSSHHDHSYPFRLDNFECTPLNGIRSHFMFCTTPTGKIAMRWVSCYCPFCVSEDWKDELTAMKAEGCVNRKVVGPWKVFNMKSTDTRSYQKRIKHYRQRGTDWCIRASSSFVRMSVSSSLDRTILTRDTKLIALRSDDDEHGFSFWIGRLTEGLKRANKGFRGVDGSRFRKGDSHVCVQYLDRTPPESPHIFTLTESEVYVHVGSVFYCDIDITERMEEGGTTVVLTDHDITCNHIHEQLLNNPIPI